MHAGLFPQPVRPVLEYVVDNPDGTYIALFGYKNDNATTVSIPVGSGNKFSPNPQDRGQPTTFQPGRQVGVFTVVFASGNQVWTLDGRTSTASPNKRPLVTLTAPVNNTTLAVPGALTLTATASDPDSNGSIQRIEFFQDNVKIGQDTTAPYELAVTGLAAGTYAFHARAIDNRNAPSLNSASATITVGAASSSLPSLTGFEASEGYTPGPLAGQQGWTATGSANVVTTPFSSGAQAVTLAAGQPLATAAKDFAAGPPQVTFVDYFARPATGATPDLGVIFQTTAGKVALAGTTPATLQAFAGNGVGGGMWQTLPATVPLDAAGTAAAWLRLTTREDYAAKKWDLYFNSRLVAYDLPFLDNTSTSLVRFSIAGHPTAPAHFDDFLAAFDNPVFADADKDGLDDSWETTHGLDPALNDRNGDKDGDTLSNILEFLLGTNPNSTDTDSDGLPDAWERSNGTNPIVSDAATDADNDGLTNIQELAAGTNPTSPDTDQDGMLDGDERSRGLNPLIADTDGDGLRDGFEHAYRLDPLSPTEAGLDPDQDGLTNLQEQQQGSDPTDFYNNVAPSIASLIPPGEDLPAGGSVKVRLNRPDGSPWANAPVVIASGENTPVGFENIPMREAARLRALLEEIPTQRTDTQGEVSIAIEAVLSLRWRLMVYPVGANAGAPLIVDVYARGRDADGNQLADAWEQLHFPDGGATATDDPDQDGLPNAAEERARTNPVRADTDDDSLSDSWELANGFDPLSGEPVATLNADADGDSLTLSEEAARGTDPTRADSDGDGLPDGYEVRAGTNPTADDSSLDTDGDGQTNAQERARGTDPSDYYNGLAHSILPFIGGDGSLGASNVLAVRVVAEDGTPLVNAPVVFTVDEGEQIALAPGGPPVGRTAEVRTGAGGIARVYIIAQPASPE